MDLMRYSDATKIRPATLEEWRASTDAARSDGGAGVITVDGEDCYVEGDGDGTMETTTAKVRKRALTRKVRRGLAWVRELVIAVFDDSMPPSAAIVKTWGRKREGELNAALEWIESREL